MKATETIIEGVPCGVDRAGFLIGDGGTQI